MGFAIYVALLVLYINIIMFVNINIIMYINVDFFLCRKNDQTVRTSIYVQF